MPDPKTVYDGGLFPEIVMGNQFDLLKHPVLSGRVRGEQDLIANSPVHELHPRDKKTSTVFIEKSYYDVSIVNHGATLHAALFEPFFYKMSFVSTTRMLALYHRIAWLPLYYPETLRSQFGDKPQKLRETYFCYPKAGYIGILGETLVRRMEEAGVTIIREGIAGMKDNKPAMTSITLKDGRRLVAPHIGWSLAHDQLVTAATGGEPNKFERWSATLIFMTIPRNLLVKTFSVLYTPDDRILFYRACNQTDSACMDEDSVRIVVEINPDYASAQGVTDEQQITARIRTDFVSLGIVADPQHIQVIGIKTLRNVLLLPCTENWKLLEQERDILLDQFPNVVFTRNVEAFFTDTLNDQIIKGLKLAEQFKAG